MSAKDQLVNRTKPVVIAALVAIASAAVPITAIAQDEPDAPDRSQDTAFQNQQMLALAKLRWQDGWRVLPDGLRLRPISGNGSGTHPAVSDTVTLHYEGRLVDGTVFDSSYARGEPATFPLGRLIRAWQIAVPQMGVGDTVELAVPADMGYGPKGRGPIPGGATMFFKIELIGILGKN